MSIERLDERAVQRINGPSWGPLKDAFLHVSEALLGTSPDAVGVLTTIYVKFQLAAAPNSGVFAIVWLKNSKQIVVGMTLPDDYDSPLLGAAPPGMKYKGLTKYMAIAPGAGVPADFHRWAHDAHQHAVAVNALG